MSVRMRCPAARAGQPRGFMMPAVMFALVILGVVWVGGLLTSDAEARSERAFRESALALYAAEAGLRTVMGGWPTTAVEALQPGDSLVVGGGWVSLPDRASYRVVIYRVDGGGLQEFQVISHGRRPSQIGGQATLTETVSGVPIFQYGVFTNGNFTMSGSSFVDAYNSGAGAYGGANIDNTNGDVGANGNVSMSGSAAIKGDATVTGTVSGTVTGTITTGAPAFPTPPNLACPTGAYTASVPGGSGISYNSGTGVLSLSGGAALTLPYPAGGYYYFSQVVLSGGSTLTVTPGANPVTIYISDKLNLSGGGVVNPSSVPANLGISACGSPSSPSSWTLSGGSGAFFTVYAPNHAVTNSGGSALYGAVVAASYVNSSGAMHFDTALLNARSNRLIPVFGSWSQVSAF